MTDRINTEKLKIYNSYSGDIDGFCRSNKTSERVVFGENLDNSWSFISSKLQDIELINKRLVSHDYAKNSLTELYETSDKEAFNWFTGKISFYADFQKVREILETIKNRTIIEADVVWSGYDNGKEFLDDLNTDIEKIKFCDFTTLDKLKMEFAPASTYQEISLSSGWNNDFLKLAELFDKLYEKINRHSKN